MQLPLKEVAMQISNSENTADYVLQAHVNCLTGKKGYADIVCTHYLIYLKTLLRSL